VSATKKTISLKTSTEILQTKPVHDGLTAILSSSLAQAQF